MEDRDSEYDAEDNVAILEKSFHGIRDAANTFQQEVKKFMTNIGFKQGRYNAITYFYEKII